MYVFTTEYRWLSSIDNSNLNVIDFIDQSIEIDTHNHRRSFKVLNLSIYRFYRFH